MLTNLASVALVALAAFLGASSAHPIEHGPALHGRDTSAEEPCKQLRDAVAAWLKDNPVGTTKAHLRHLMIVSTDTI